MKLRSNITTVGTVTSYHRRFDHFATFILAKYYNGKKKQNTFSLYSTEVFLKIFIVYTLYYTYRF